MFGGTENSDQKYSMDGDAKMLGTPSLTDSTR